MARPAKRVGVAGGARGRQSEAGAPGGPGGQEWGPAEGRTVMAGANQVAVITGASSGIGWALARILAAQGCKVGLVARRRELLEALAQEIKQAGGIADFAPADVAERASTVEAIRTLGSRLGPVDLLI